MPKTFCRHRARKILQKLDRSRSGHPARKWYRHLDAVIQHDRAPHRIHLDRDARMALLKICKTRNEPELRERVAHIERNDASLDACRLRRSGDHSQRRSDLLEEPKSLARQFDRIVAANEKPLSDL